MKWLKNILKSKEEKDEEAILNDPVAYAKAMVAEAQESIKESDNLIEQLQNQTPEESEWTNWFYNLPENEKQMVELCRKNGIDINKHNFEATVKEILKQAGT